MRDLLQNFVERESKGGNRSVRHRRARLLPLLELVEFLDKLMAPLRAAAECGT